jgi:hypothetical protein
MQLPNIIAFFGSKKFHWRLANCQNQCSWNFRDRTNVGRITTSGTVTNDSSLAHGNELALHKLLRGDTERVGGARGK